MMLIEQPAVAAVLVAAIAFLVRTASKYRRLYRALLAWSRIVAAALEQVHDDVKATKASGTSSVCDPDLLLKEVKRTIGGNTEDQRLKDGPDVHHAQAEILASVADKQADETNEGEQERKRFPRLRRWMRRTIRGQNMTGTAARRAARAAVSALLKG